MTQIPNILIPDKGTSDSGPFWREDARERLHILLPELVASIVTATCMTTLATYQDIENLGVCIVAMCLVQIFTHAVLYVFTYLTRNLQSSYIGLAAIFAFFYVAGVSSTVGDSLGMHFGNFELYVAVATMMGAMLFYATRPRWALVLLAIGLVAVVIEDGAQAELVPVLLVGFTSYLVLFVIRNSAVRITVDYVPPQRSALERKDDGQVNLPFGGIHGQVAILGALVGVLCLAVALVSFPLFGQLPESGEPASSPASTTAAQEGQPADAGTDGNATDDKHDNSEPAAAESAAAENATAESTTAEPATETDGGGGASQRDSALVDLFGLIAPLLLPVAVALSYAVRLFLRKKARQGIESEPREADRVAKIYLGIISRLEAAGIAREQFETPQEFFASNETELAELTASAGISAETWSTLTSTYEKSRYADLAPTESELETCWKLYDALPSCTRRAIGWPRYLVGAFWRM